MSLFQRFSLSLRAWLNAFFASAQDPRETFAYAYQRQRELVVKVQQALEDMATSKKQLEAKTGDVREKLPQLENQAQRALIEGRENLARLALQRRQVALVELQTLEQQVREVEQEEQRLSIVEQRLVTQIEAFFARQEIMAARYTAAEAQVRISEALTGVSEELADLGVALERAEQKTESMQARATAIDRLVEAGVLEVPGLPGGDLVERQLSELDVTQAVEDQLATLKSGLMRERLERLANQPSESEPPQEEGSVTNP